LGEVVGWGTLISFLSGIVGVSVGFGMLRSNVINLTKQLASLQREWNVFRGVGGNPGEPAFIRRVECEGVHAETTEEMKHIIRKVDGVRNVLRWMLTQKEGMGLVEVQKLLNGDD